MTTSWRHLLLGAFVGALVSACGGGGDGDPALAAVDLPSERGDPAADEADPTGPFIGDHWHVAYGVFVCDRYQPPLMDEAGDRTGIHTHGDGLIHIHPFVSDVTGTGATLGRFAEQVGLDLAADRLVLPDGEVLTSDSTCDGRPATLRVLRWPDAATDRPSVESGDPNAIHLGPDGSVLAIVFAPEGSDPALPPSVVNLEDPTAAEEGREPVHR